MYRTIRSIATRLLAPICLIALAFPAWTNPLNNGVVSFEYGYFCAIPAAGERPAEDTMAGSIKVLSETPRFAKHTTIVPAMIGVDFGILVQVVPDLAGPAVFYTEHPPQGDHGITTESWTGTLTADRPTYVGFGFEYDFELTPGPWTLSAMQNGRQVYEITFDVVPASAALDPDLYCGPELVS